MINYVLRLDNYKLYISRDSLIIIKDIPIQKYFNTLLIPELTDMYSRLKQTRKYLKFKSKIPLYLDKNNLFLCIRSYRTANSLYINYFSIMSYDYGDDFVIINFKSKHCMKIYAKHCFKMQIKKCMDIIDFLD